VIRPAAAVAQLERSRPAQTTAYFTSYVYIPAGSQLAAI